jgi:hypothetical protein
LGFLIFHLKDQNCTLLRNLIVAVSVYIKFVRSSNYYNFNRPPSQPLARISSEPRLAAVPTASTAAAAATAVSSSTTTTTLA